MSSGPGTTGTEEASACRNSLDDDCDGFVDCTDEDCRDALECCMRTSGEESRETSCNDGRNNECDAVGLDCFDPDCATDAACCQAPVGGEADQQMCLNGADDDCDGLSDCADPQCAGVTQCCKQHLMNNGQNLTTDESAACSDKYDNDCDGLINCDDPDCATLGLRLCGVVGAPRREAEARWDAPSPI